MERTARGLLPQRAAEMFGIELAAEELERIDEFVELLARWSGHMNLMATCSRDEIINRHVLDSLALTNAARRTKEAADLGSGAGFPGLLMAITAPKVRVHLVEARERKAAFLREVARRTALGNVHVYADRAETWRPQASLGLVAVRGLRPDVVATWARPILRDGGDLALMRKHGAAECDYRGFEELERLRYRLPGGERHEVLLLRRRN